MAISTRQVALNCLTPVTDGLERLMQVVTRHLQACRACWFRMPSRLCPRQRPQLLSLVTSARSPSTICPADLARGNLARPFREKNCGCRQLSRTGLLGHPLSDPGSHARFSIDLRYSVDEGFRRAFPQVSGSHVRSFDLEPCNAAVWMPEMRDPNTPGALRVRRHRLHATGDHRLCLPHCQDRRRQAALNAAIADALRRPRGS